MEYKARGNGTIPKTSTPCKYIIWVLQITDVNIALSGNSAKSPKTVYSQHRIDLYTFPLFIERVIKSGCFITL